jgi:transposase InsO family protein
VAARGVARLSILTSPSESDGDIDMDMRAGSLEISIDEQFQSPPNGHYKATVLTALKEAVRDQDMSLPARAYLAAALKAQAPHSGAGGAMTAHYPSARMGVCLTTSRGWLGLAALLELESDPDVVAVFDLPPAQKVSASSNQRKRVSFLLHPQFAVVRRSHTELLDIEHEESLRKKVASGSNLYQLTDQAWACPSAREAAEKMGFRHVIWTESNFSRKRVANLRLLEDYYDGRPLTQVQRDALTEVGEAVCALGGPTIDQLVQHLKGVAVIDDVLRGIARGVVCVDMQNSYLGELHKTRVFRDQASVEAMTNSESSLARAPDWTGVETPTVKAGDHIDWDGIHYEVVQVGATETVLQRGDQFRPLPNAKLQDLLSSGSVKRLSSSSTTLAEARREDALEIVVSASPKALACANARMHRIEPYLTGLKHAPQCRSLRRYLLRYRQAQQAYGNGFVGLLPQTKGAGSRVRRLQEDVLTIVNNTINELYEDLRNINKLHVHGDLRLRCEEAGVPVPSYSWFCRYIGTLNKYRLRILREGKKSAYQIAPRRCQHQNSVDIPAARAFERAHVDHTQLDVEAISTDTGENLGRPWLTVMIDEFTRRVLGFFLSFEPPSYRSVLMTMRDCVRRYKRLPSALIVDGGKEFCCTWFQVICAFFLVKPFYRKGKPRWGSHVERFFGSENTMLVHNLTGNTQLTRNARQMTDDVNPARAALWTLSRLYDVHAEFLFEIYETMPHRGILATPRQAFEQSCSLHGAAPERLIPYTERFLIATCPTTRSGKAKVTCEGVKINYFWFNSPLLYPLAGQSIDVRFEPYDLSTAWGLVAGQWVRLTSRFDGALKGLTQRQLAIHCDEYRKQRGVVERKRLTDCKLATYLREVRMQEAVLLEKKRAAELRYALDPTTGSPGADSASLHSIVVDASSNRDDAHSDEDGFGLEHPKLDGLDDVDAY